MSTIITFGTFDLFHIGHARILKRASEYGDNLVVGVSSDELNFFKKKRYPVYSQEDRIEIISSLKYVTKVFLEESLELKAKYIIDNNADVLIMGDDWKGRFDEYNRICKVVYLDRTPSISTSEIIEVVKTVRNE